MKKILIKLTFIIAFTISSAAVLAQGPPPPPGNPTDGGVGPVGGPAPIGGGIAILLSLGAAYGGRKVYKYWQSRKEDLEE
ncbi:MAG: hypothetical protein RBR87_12875 [Bacteroidales bacterium]|jgi:hypothetical protein|nr:hypothetical protein [Bacteroidales bacterium]